MKKTKYKNSFCKNCNWQGNLDDLETTSEHLTTCPQCKSFEIDHTTTPQRYFVDTDEDGHWYVIPVEHRQDWLLWVTSTDETVYSVIPNYIKQIDFNKLTFTDPK